MTPILGIMASGISGNLVTNSYESIATGTVSTPTATIAFSSIPATYKHLQVRYIAKSGRAQNLAGQMVMRFNGSYGARGHNLYGDGATAFANSYVPAIGEYSRLRRHQ